MNFSKYFNKFVWVLAALMAPVVMAGCSADSVLDDPDGVGEVPDEITLTFNLPAEDVVNLGTRAAEPGISSLTVMCFDKDGRGLSTRSYTSGWNAVSNGYKMTVGIHRKTRSIQVVTNHSIPDNASGASDPSTIYTSDVNAGVLWGKAELKDILAAGSRLTLLRANAKVSVKSSASGFALQGFGVYGTAAQGSLAPSAANYNAAGCNVTAPTYRTNDAFNTDIMGSGANAEIAVFETPEVTTNATARKCARVIIKGRYNGVDGYYPVAFRVRSGSGDSETPGAYAYTPIPVLRNHHYKIEVLEVRSQGWPTYEEARNAEPDNRLTILMTDQDDSIIDITATRDYMLGIGGDIMVEYQDETAYVDVLTSYSGTPVFTADQSWVKAAGAQLGSATVVTGITEGVNNTGRKYHVALPIEKNEHSNIARSANVTVRCGDLTRTFILTQKGRDYKRDPQRKVVVVGIPGGTINDYYHWIDNDVNGLLPEQNRGEERNRGLHFPAVNLYTVEYRIPKLDGDHDARITDGAFSLSQSGNYWVVKANNTSTPKIEIGHLKLRNADNAEIEYPLYRTGVFHQLTAAYDDLMRREEKIHGWFYYEIVKVGKPATGYKYIMDRNLGSPTNAPYISTYAPYRNNKAAVGAYFKVATQKSEHFDDPKTVTSQLNVGRFRLPTRLEMINYWFITVSDAAGATGSAGEVSRVATVYPAESKVAGNVVYIPHGGYYDGLTPKYETHANLWTRTLLSGNQGFSENSPEFGYWYMLLDVIGSQVNFTNKRFFHGVNGQAPTEESVYKFMPMRLQWE